jgi:hypothetical protein
MRKPKSEPSNVWAPILTCPKCLKNYQAVAKDMRAVLPHHVCVTPRERAENAAAEFCTYTKQADCTQERLTDIIEATIRTTPPAPLTLRELRATVAAWHQEDMPITSYADGARKAYKRVLDLMDSASPEVTK